MQTCNFDEKKLLGTVGLKSEILMLGHLGHLKETVACDGSFDHITISLYPRYRIRIFFSRTLASFSVFGECAKIFKQLMRTL
jgi:hypothetical protein